MSAPVPLEIAMLGGGCFWCLEAAFSELEGVEGVESGYMGGEVERPGYEAVCGGLTGHAEVVRIRFDPAVIAYVDLLRVFFTIHDPTTLNRQGNDVGSQYRSAIFWHDTAQKALAEDCVAGLEAEGRFGRPIVTEIREAGRFWPAEDYHRDYYRRHPGRPYCQFVVGPKVAKVRAAFASRLKK